MTRPVRLPPAALVLLCLIVGLESQQGVTAAPGGAPVPQWHLDIERAMDVIGLAPGMVVGEAGAGDGYFTIPMARRVGPSGVILANDISERALRSLEQRSTTEGLANVRTVVGSVADPLFPQRDLQLVVLVHAFHDFTSPGAWLVNLKKYLRPGARVAVIDRDPAQGAESHFWPRERIIRIAGEAGYQLTKAEYDISEHLILVFKVQESGASGRVLD